MRKSEFETKLIVGIASHRLALLSEIDNRSLFYSKQMYDPEDVRKIYLLELREDYFIIRSDLIFDESVGRFFYVTKDIIEYSEANLRSSLKALRQTEHRVYEILTRLRLRGYYTKADFIRRITHLIPQLDWVGTIVKDRKSGTTFITIREDVLHLTYSDGKTESYMDITKKDFNDKIITQCVELITAALKLLGS